MDHKNGQRDAAPTSRTPSDAPRYGGGLLDHQLPLETRRLRALEEFADPTTQRMLAATGLSSGWRCLEVGAGAGSIATWLARRSAPEETVATDLDTSLLHPLPAENLTVLRHDVTHDEFPTASFDLLHARALLEHLPDREAALARMRSWVRPGGWICLDAITLETTALPGRHALRRCTAAMETLINRRMGASSRWTLGLPHLMAQAGLDVVEVTCTPGTVGASGTANAVIGLSLEQLAPALVADDLATEEEIAAALELLQDTRFHDISFLVVSVRSRR